MSKEYEINGELAAVEAALASLKPGASGINRDRMMFLAGQASVSVPSPPPVRRSTPWHWPVAAAASLCLAIGFGCLFFFFGSPRGEKQIVYVDVNNGKTEAVAAPKLWYDNVKSETANNERPRSMPGVEGMDYLSLSRLIAAKGVEALPLPKIDVLAPIDLSPGRPMTIRDWNTYLNND
jgi:hypothetical protein